MLLSAEISARLKITYLVSYIVIHTAEELVRIADSLS